MHGRRKIVSDLENTESVMKRTQSCSLQVADLAALRLTIPVRLETSFPEPSLCGDSNRTTL